MSGLDEYQRSRTILWCVPRTASTAITKCLSAIENNQIWFEPYQFCENFAMAWKQSKKTEPSPDCKGNEEEYQQVIDLLAETTSVHFKQDHISYASLKRHLETVSSSHVFVKDMAFNPTKHDTSHLPEGYKHTFLIRHPLKAMYSFRQSVYKYLLKQGVLKGSAAEEESFDVELDNPFFSCFQENQYAMWKYVRQNIDSHPIVIDSDEFLANPAEMLPKYCQAVGLPHDKSLLKWDASTGVVKRWKVPADDLFEHGGHFYDTAIRSCEFFAASEMPSRENVTPDVIRYTDRVLNYYVEMYESRIRLGGSDRGSTGSHRNKGFIY